MSDPRIAELEAAMIQAALDHVKEKTELQRAADAKLIQLEAAMVQAELDHAKEKMELQRELTKVMNKYSDLQKVNSTLLAENAETEVQCRQKISANYLSSVEIEVDKNTRIAQLTAQLEESRSDIMGLTLRCKCTEDEKEELKKTNMTLRAQICEQDRNLAMSMGAMQVHEATPKLKTTDMTPKAQLAMSMGAMQVRDTTPVKENTSSFKLWDSNSRPHNGWGASSEDSGLGVWASSHSDERASGRLSPDIEDSVRRNPGIFRDSKSFRP